mmetsp:Transcript_5789/g.14453  ORF Transcript_5789/g.14453 Transcript_5789/m.14453 type:complete len:105 (-) Transcript_5789:133-447(-)
MQYISLNHLSNTRDKFGPIIQFIRNRCSGQPLIPRGSFTAYSPPACGSESGSMFSYAVVMNKISRFSPPKQQQDASDVSSGKWTVKTISPVVGSMRSTIPVPSP